MKLHKILGFLACSLLVGCGFLDEYSHDKFKPSTVLDYDAILTREGYSISTVNPLGYYDLLTDDVSTFNSARVGNNPDKDIIEQDRASITNSEPFYSWDVKMYETAITNKIPHYNTWAVLYKLILPCNVVINDLPKAVGSEQSRGYLMAQAKFLRANYYYYLVNLYANPYNSGDPSEMVGVPIVNTYRVDNNFPRQSSVKEVYDYIIKELEESEELFKKYSPKEGALIIRISLSSVYGLLSRVAMQMDDWEAVIDYSRKGLAVNNHLDDIQTFVTSTSVVSGVKHVRNMDIKKRPYSMTDNEPKEMLFGCFFGNGSSFSQSFFTDGGRRFYSRSYMASSELMNLYETTKTYGKTNGDLWTVNGDLRYLYFYFHGGSYERGEGTWHSGIYTTARYGIKTQTSLSSNVAGMRTAELYLNLAEALIRTDKSVEAFELLNHLRKHRWFGDGYQVDERGNKEDNLKFCLEERRRELSFEHVRWFDLRRLGRPRLVHEFVYSGNPAAVLEEKDLRYTLPIPQEVKDRNPELI